MTPRELLSRRLSAQSIQGGVETSPTVVLSSLGMIQAQDFASAQWALGLRTSGATLDTIDHAIRNRDIVRTWLARGTLHLAPAEDIRWMLGLFASRLIAASAHRRRQLGLDDATFARARRVLEQQMAGSRCLTREEVYLALESGGIAMDNHRGYHILWRLALEQVLCFGPHADKQPTFTLLAEHVPRSANPSHEEALATLALRYFSSRGPASREDFVNWSGLVVADARLAIEVASAHLEKVEFAGKSYWMRAGLAAPKRPGAFLLPGFDEYLLGYRERSHALDPAHAAKIVPGNNGIFLPTVVLGGRIRGLWKRTLRKTQAVVTIEPFEPLTEAEQRALAKPAEEYGRFLGLSVKLS